MVAGTMLVVAGGAAVFMFETTDGGRTRMSAAESVVVATDKFINTHEDCVRYCQRDCLEICGRGAGAALCDVDCENNSRSLGCMGNPKYCNY